MWSNDLKAMLEVALLLVGSPMPDLNKKGYPGPPGCGVGVRLTTLPRQKYVIRYFYQSLGMGIIRLRRLGLWNLDLDAETEELEKVCRRQGCLEAED